MQVITPRLRPVVLAMLNAKEKDIVAHLVDCMIAYGLTYKQTHEDGSYDYKLEPSIDVLHLPVEDMNEIGQVMQSDKNLSDILPQAVRYGIKQVCLVSCDCVNDLP